MKLRHLIVSTALFPLCGCQIVPPAGEPEVPTISNDERVANARASRGDHYADLLALFLEDTPTAERGGIVFLGDSITEQFPLEAAFPGQNIHNRGIGGDVIEGATERLNVSVADLHPSRVIVMIGINNLVWASPDLPLDDLMSQYNRLFDGISAAAPDASVALMSVLPARGRWSSGNAQVQEVNARLEAIADERGFEFVDLYPHFLDDEGVLRETLAKDAVHLNTSGYVTWLEVLLPPEEFMQALINLGPEFLAVENPARRLDKYNPSTEGTYGGNRGRNELIVYTPDYGQSTTGTNEWGQEAIVENGVVTSLNVGDSAIPENGFVVSGHLLGAWWINRNLKPGTAVECDGETISIVLTAWDEMATREQIALLRVQALEMVLDQPESEEARSLLLETIQIDDEDVESIAATRDSLSAGSQ